jgi:hypothetical protein
MKRGRRKAAAASAETASLAELPVPALDLFDVRDGLDHESLLLWAAAEDATRERRTGVTIALEQLIGVLRLIKAAEAHLERARAAGYTDEWTPQDGALDRRPELNDDAGGGAPAGGDDVREGLAE